MSRVYENSVSDDEDMESTALEIESDERNIKKNHNLDKKSLLDKGKASTKSPSCRTMMCKAVIIATAGVLFILMLVELWSDYGTVISTQTLFPPKIHNMFESCPDATHAKQLTKEYNALACDWTLNATVSELTCNGNIPKHPMVIASGVERYDNMHVDEQHICVTWEGQINNCVSLLIWSI